MSENLIGILILFVMYSLQAFIDKSASNYSKGNAATMGYGVAKNFICTVISFCIISFGGMAMPTAPVILISLLAGIPQAVCTVTILWSLQKYSIMQVNLFMTASVLVPIVAGMFLFDENFTVFKAFLIIAIIFGSGLILGINKLSDLKFGGKSFLLLIIVWFFYGAIMLAQKMYAKYIPKGNIMELSLYMYFIGTATLLIWSLFSKIKQCSKNEKVLILPKGKLLAFCVSSAVVILVMTYYLTSLSATLPTYLLFPLTNGSKLIFVLIISYLVFKERPTKRMLFGCLIVISAVLLL
ncbi:MAG: hypothetical protein E7551_05710 [Ruminococcaceae bacterium]|nr:hypothetical protein [Oscillospiraceae bacterium]